MVSENPHSQSNSFNKVDPEVRECETCIYVCIGVYLYSPKQIWRVKGKQLQFILLDCKIDIDSYISYLF